MTVLIKLAYAAAVAALMVLLVAFGVRAFYPSPDQPEYPQMPQSFRAPVAAPAPASSTATAAVVTPAPQELARYEEDQRQYQQAYERFEGERRDYRRNVFLMTALISVAAVAGGAALWSRIDAVSLGFVAGGLATLLYGVIQAAGDLDEISPTLIFVAVLAGLALVLAAGYRWLSER